MIEMESTQEMDVSERGDGEIDDTIKSCDTNDDITKCEKDITECVDRTSDNDVIPAGNDVTPVGDYIETAIHTENNRDSSGSSIGIKSRPESVLSEDFKYISPLEIAATQFDVEKVQFLLQQDDIDASEINSDGKNVLHEMVSRFVELDFIKRAENKPNFIETLKCLVKKGIDVNTPIINLTSTTIKQSRWTVLHVAAIKPETGDVIRVLTSSGSKVNCEDGHQQTALFLAVNKALLSNVQALLEAGSDPNKQDEFGKTPLHLAVKGRNRSLDIIQALLNSESDVSITDSTGRTPVHVAAKHANVKVMELLLGNGGDVNKIDVTGQSPLHYAAVQDCSGGVVQRLLKASVVVNKQSSITNETALHQAVRHRMTHNVISLCNHSDLDINLTDLYGETALHKACDQPDWGLWTALLNSGGDVLKTNTLGVTPLSFLRRANNKLAPLIEEWVNIEQPED